MSCTTLPDKTAIRYLREGDRLKEIRRDGPLPYSFEPVKYDQQSNPTQMRLPVQARMLYVDYDLLNRPLNIASSEWNESLTYDKQLLGQCTLQDAFGEAVSSYTYDAKEQLLTETGVAENAFKLDRQGNIKEHNGHARKFNACNALLKEAKHSYSYDLNGNRTSDGVNTYTYDPLDRLVRVKTPTDVYHYVYDGLDRRVAKIHDKETTHFLWQQEQEIGTITASGKIQELQVLSPANRPVAFELQGELYIPITDQFGHLRVLLDPEGNCVSSYRYSAFGKEQVYGQTLSPWRYSGKRTDTETGLIYFGKRYYDPHTFCWMTPDPLEDVDGPNYYAYVKNNPLHYVDPDGRFVIAIPIAIEIFSIAWGASTVVTAGVTVQAVAGTVAGIALGAVVYQADQYCDKVYYKGREKSEKDRDRDISDYDDFYDKPPNHPDYKQPKNWNGQKVRNPNGRGAGFPHRGGDVWVPTNHGGTHAPHWDVQHPNGGHTNVYPKLL